VIRYNDIGDDGIELIAEALKTNKLLVKDTAEFLVQNFIEKKEFNLSYEIIFLEHYQRIDKSLLESDLEGIFQENNVAKSQKDLVADQNITKHTTDFEEKIMKNFFKLSGVCKKEIILQSTHKTIKVKENNAFNPEDSTSGNKRKQTEEFLSDSSKCTTIELRAPELGQSKHPFINQDLSKLIASFFSKLTFGGIYIKDNFDDTLVNNNEELFAELDLSKNSNFASEPLGQNWYPHSNDHMQDY
jgi:hypothetical protein